MNNTVNEVSLFFVTHYPYPEELSKTRLTKMVYLADWENSLKFGEQITNIKWFFDHYGPYVPDVYDESQNDDRLSIENSFSAYGTPKTIISYSDRHFTELGVNLSHQQISILNKVINDTEYLNWNEFIEYVYNTTPIKKSRRYSYLNLVDFARDAIHN